MFIPLQAARNHLCGGGSHPVPSITTVEKVVLVVSALTFFACVGGAAALFALDFIPFGVFAVAMLPMPVAAWIVTADKLGYRPVPKRVPHPEVAILPPPMRVGYDFSPGIRAAEPLPAMREVTQHEDRESKQLLGHLPIGLTYEPEFLRLLGVTIPEPKEDKLGRAVQTKLHQYCVSKIEVCGAGYHSDDLAKALADLFSENEEAKQRALLFTLPFFVAVYRERGEKRTQVLETLVPFLRGQFSSMDDRIFAGLERCLTFAAPLTQLLAESDFEGKPFLFDALHQLVFHVTPAVMESAREDEVTSPMAARRRAAIEEYRALVTASSAPIAADLKAALATFDVREAALKETREARAHFHAQLTKVAMPQLSRMIVGEIDVLAYVAALKSGRETAPLLCRPNYADLLPFANTIDRIFTQIDGQARATAADLGGKAAGKTEYEVLLGQLQTIFGHLLGHFKTHFGEGVTPGEIVVRSYLIGHEMWNVFPSDETRVEHAMQWLGFVQQAVRQAGIKASEVDLRAVLTPIFARLQGDRAEAVKIIPFHDLIPLLLTGFFAARHLHKARPFIQENLDTLFLIVDDFEAVLTTLLPDPELVSQMVKYKGIVKAQMTLFLALMKPFNGLLTGKWVPGKSTLIKKAMSSGMKKMLKGQDDPQFCQAIEALFPILQFVILGVFGSHGERRAFQDLSANLEQLYSVLYNFDPSHMASHPGELQEHIRRALQPLSDTGAGAAAC